MFVPNFEAIGHVILVLEPEKAPRKFGVKSGLRKNDLSTAKNILYGCMSLNTLSSPTNPLLAAMRLISFFFPFFSFFPNCCTLFFS